MQYGKSSRRNGPYLVLLMLSVKRTTCSINLLLPAFKKMFRVAIKLISVLLILLKGRMSIVCHKIDNFFVWYGLVMGQPSLPLNNSVTPPQVYSKVSELNSSVLTCYTWHHLEMSCINMKNRSALGSITLRGSKWGKTSCAMSDYVFLYRTEPFETQMGFHLDLWMSEWMYCRVYTRFTEARKCNSAVQIFYIYISVFLYINNALWFLSLLFDRKISNKHASRNWLS